MSTNPKIFLSYRRDDSAFQTTAIHEKLTDTFGVENVFMDVDNIPAGRDFRRHLQLAVEQCDVCLIVIGDRWLNSGETAAGRRIDDPRDFVRIEVEAALKRDIPVIPLMVGKSPMPTASELPDCIAELSYRQGLSVRPGRDFRADMQLLINQIRQNAKPQSKSTSIPVSATLVENVIAMPIAQVVADGITTTSSDAASAIDLAPPVEENGACAVDESALSPSPSVLQLVLRPVIQLSRAYERLLDYVAGRRARLLSALALLLSLFMAPSYRLTKGELWMPPDESLIWAFSQNLLVFFVCVLSGSWCRRRIERVTSERLSVVPSIFRADASVLLILALVRVALALIGVANPKSSFSAWEYHQGLLPFGIALAGLALLSHTASVCFRSRLLRTAMAAGIWALLLVWLMPFAVGNDSEIVRWYYPLYSWCTAFWALLAVGVDGMTKFWPMEKSAG